MTKDHKFDPEFAAAVAAGLEKHLSGESEPKSAPKKAGLSDDRWLRLFTSGAMLAYCQLALTDEEREAFEEGRTSGRDYFSKNIQNT